MSLASKNFANTIDRLGKIKAQLADLRVIEAELRQKIIDAGIDEGDGKLFHASVAHCQSTVIDYRGLVEKLAPPPSLVKKFTTQSEVVRISIHSRKS